MADMPSGTRYARSWEKTSRFGLISYVKTWHSAQFCNVYPRVLMPICSEILRFFFDKPIPDLYRALFYGTGMANKAKIKFDQHEYTIHLRLTTKAEDSFVAVCVQKQNLKALELLQKTFEFDMKQDGYRLPRDACIRYVLFYQLRETTMKWIRTQWANFFNRLDNESFGCPADPVEQFAVNFFESRESFRKTPFATNGLALFPMNKKEA